MQHNHTDITIVLDRSGSMSSVASDTIGGFNRFLDDQRKAAGTANITLHQFDDIFETKINCVDVRQAAGLSAETFVPRGNTALLDAIGQAVKEAGVRLEANPAEKVVFVIITDGHENASRKYSRSDVFGMIDHQKTKYNWHFVFLGSNQDAMSAGQILGVPRGNSMTFAATGQGVNSAYSVTSSNLRSLRSAISGRTDAMAFTADDREKQKKAGAAA